MSDLFFISSNRPTLFYKSNCHPCRWMSRLVVVFSFGYIRRIPLSSPEAQRLYSLYPKHDGQLVLVRHSQPMFGRKVFAVVPLEIVRCCWRIVTLRGLA